MELGVGNFGCTHYRRRCKIKAPCCNKVFDCKHCHNEAKNFDEIKPIDCHDIPRHQVTKSQWVSNRFDEVGSVPRSTHFPLHRSPRSRSPV